MRRIRDTRENESLKNAEEAFERFSFQKHKRWNIIRFEENLPENLQIILQEIIDETFSPSGYDEKWIFDKKARKLAKAPVHDHVAEATAMLPYERQVYDYIVNDHGEHDMDYGNRTKIGKWYMTDERLKIHYPGQVSRRQAYSLYGKQSTPDKKDGMNLFSQMDTTEMKRGVGKEICAFCPHINNCRNALFHEDQERMYD